MKCNTLYNFNALSSIISMSSSQHPANKERLLYRAANGVHACMHESRDTELRNKRYTKKEIKNTK
jgi:hypothetical protein